MVEWNWLALYASVDHIYKHIIFVSRTPAGYCFVDFGDYTVSQKVMGKLNGLPIPGSNPVSDSNDQILEVLQHWLFQKLFLPISQNNLFTRTFHPRNLKQMHSKGAALLEKTEICMLVEIFIISSPKSSLLRIGLQNPTDWGLNPFRQLALLISQSTQN